jgi:uncharacterized protein (DUF305 family)
MGNKIIATVLVALVVGLGLGYVWGGSQAASPQAKTHLMSDGTVMSNESHMQDSMQSMMAGLSGKSGDAFDLAFLSEMIVHHEGAVEMAQAALQNAKHSELKTMAGAIITAQTSEIAQMRNWLKDWYDR